MAVSGKAVSVYFEEKLQEIFPGQSFPEPPDEQTVDTNEKEKEMDREGEETEDSDDDFIQPRRKRLKTDDNIFHIK